MKARITLRQIAEKAGVHFTTVARALRNNPVLPAETREKIQALAKEMGYTPDPMMSALSVYRTSLRRVTYRSTIAWLYGYQTKGHLFTIDVHLRLFTGAKKGPRRWATSWRTFGSERRSSRTRGVSKRFLPRETFGI